MNDCNIMGGWVLLAVSRSKQKNNLDMCKSKVLREASQDFVKVASQVRLASYHGLDKKDTHLASSPMGDGYRDQLHVR